MIELRIPYPDLIKYNTPMEEQTMVLSRLREAGIPVMGTAFLVSLEKGELSMRRDSVSKDLIYQWRDR